MKQLSALKLLMMNYCLGFTCEKNVNGGKKSMNFFPYKKQLKVKINIR